MESKWTTWLDMVFAALSEPDDIRRGWRLEAAQNFLEQSRRQDPSQAESANPAFAGSLGA